MRTFPLIIFLSALVLIEPVQSQELERYAFQSHHMGTRFNIVLYAKNDSVANAASEEAFERIEELNQIMSDYLKDSELNRLSRTSGSGENVRVSSELFEVLKESLRMAEVSNGLFDVTIGPMTKFWRAVRMSPDPQLPDEEKIRKLQKKVGYENLKLNEKKQTVKLLKQGMQLDLGGIAKGYAAGQALDVLRNYGITKALIDAGGDVTLGDPPPGRESWDVAVPKPRANNQNRFITLQLSNYTVTTSGDLFQYVVIDGKRYSHILNPGTGLGATRQIQATVISQNGMQADALASVLTLTEPEKGIELINSMDQTEAVILMNQGGTVEEWQSDGLKPFLESLKSNRTNQSD